MVGDGQTSSFCTSNIDHDAIPKRERSGLGLPIPFKVVVRTELGGTPVVEETFHSLCTMGHMTNYKIRNMSRLYLNEGNHRIEVYNLEPQPAFAGVKVQMSLVSGDAK